MSETIEVGNGWIVDRAPCEELIRLVEELFPDDQDDLGDGDDNAVFRAAIINELKRGGSALRLGERRESPPYEKMKLKQCDRSAEQCNRRRRD